MKYTRVIYIGAKGHTTGEAIEDTYKLLLNEGKTLEVSVTTTLRAM